MTRIYTTTFAATGDKETLAATDPGTGKVSLPSGWTPDYEKVDSDPSYRPVGRKEMNGVINEVTAAVGELQQYGFAPWQALTGGWPLNARVVSGGIVYKSTAAANTAVPPAAPWVMDAVADINSAPAKPVLADADELGVTDSANSFGLVKVTWANLKGQLAGTHNKIINGNFGVNQRAVSGTVVLTAGQYGHDRFKAGASGCIYTFATSANVTTLTISAGSLVQVIEGINLFSGSVVLSWAGTAQGKIGGGSYGVSGVLGTATGGTNMSVEFGTGTLSKVQLEYGVTPSVFEHRPYGMELALCQRYFYKIENHQNSYVVAYTDNGTIALSQPVSLPVPMRTTPTGVSLALAYRQIANLSGAAFGMVSTIASVAAGASTSTFVLIANGSSFGGASTGSTIHWNDLSNFLSLSAEL